MPDRLSELARQRALVLEHLAWLDREIASVQARPAIPSVGPTPLEAAPPPAPVVTPPAEKKPPGVAPEPDTILDQYRVAPATLKNDVRKGCFLYFVAAFVVVGLVIAVLYFAIGSR